MIFIDAGVRRGKRNQAPPSGMVGMLVARTLALMQIPTFLGLVNPVVWVMSRSVRPVTDGVPP